jgi:PAS domain S-box-containing protein
MLSPHRVFALLLACVLAVLWLAVFWGNRKAEQDAHAQMRQQTAALAMAFAEHTDSTLRGADHVMLELREAWLENPKTFASAIARQQTLLGDTALQIAVIAADGYLAYSNLAPVSARVDLGDREHFKVHRDGGQADQLFISRPIKGRVSGKWSIQLTRPIFNAGRFAGVVVLSLDPGYFVRYYQRFDLGAQGIISIVRDTGEVMARSVGQEQHVGKVINTAPVTDAGATPQGSYFRSASQTDGIERLFSYARLPERGLSVRIGVSVNDYLAPVREGQRNSWLIAGAVTAVLILLSWLLLRGVTRLETAENVLDKDRQRLADIIVGTHVGTWEWNVQSGEAVFNERWAEIIGYTLHELAPVSIDTWMKFAHPDDLKLSGELLEKHFAGELDYYECESRMRHKDGHWAWVLDRGRVASWTADGKPLLMSGTHQDITERKDAETHLLEAELLLRSAVETIGEAFVVYDAEDRLAFCNEKYRELYHLSAPVIEPGRSFEEIIRYGVERGQYKGAIGREEAWVAERLAAHREGNQELIQQLDDGRWLKITERHTPSGHTVGFRIDITELYRAKQAAEAANNAKSRFLATMSHEIRTPMNGILGMAQMLLMPNIKDDERQDYARTILTSGQTLLALLNDILDLSKVEAGKFELESVALDPAQVLHEIRTLFAESATHKGLRIESDWAGSTEQAALRYLGDPHRLRQMLSNLVGNALKFTEKGHIRIEAREVERDGPHALLEFAVSDTGIGIPPDKQVLLFKPFSQADSSTTRQYGGSGLGLSLVRSMAQLMGGEVGIESEVGQGSRFWFRIRVDLLAPGVDSRNEVRQAIVGVSEENPSETGGAPTGVYAGTFTGHILAVDDNPTNRLVLKAMLKKSGVRCDFVEDGQQAVDAITGGMNPDLVLMDCQMPVMDGFEATLQIRRWEIEQAEHAENARPRLTIVALTAGAFEEDRQRCFKVGMDDFMAKPVTMERLTATLVRWLGVVAEVVAEAEAVAEAGAVAGVVAEAAVVSKTAEAASTPQEDGPPVFDENTLLSQLGGDRELARIVIGSATEDIPNYFAQLEQAIAAGNWQAAERQTHTMKGLTAQVGGMKLSAHMKALDDHLKAGGGTDSATLIDLHREYQLLSDTLLRWTTSLATTTPAPAEKPFTPDQIIALYLELDALLSQKQFDAVGRFKALQELVAGTEVPAEVVTKLAETGKLIAEFSFDLAREHLHQIAVQQGWDRKKS